MTDPTDSEPVRASSHVNSNPTPVVTVDTKRKRERKTVTLPRWAFIVLLGAVLVLMIAALSGRGASAVDATAAGSAQELASATNDDERVAELEQQLADAQAAADARVAVCQSDIAVISGAASEVASAFSESSMLSADVLTRGATYDDVAAMEAINQRVVDATTALDAVQGCV